MVNTIFTDFNEPSVDVYLHIKISSNLVSLETKSSYKPSTRTTLFPGRSKTFKGSDLAPYLNYNNLNLSGITFSELSKTGRLPDGNYQFCVTVKEYNSGRSISNASCAMAVLTQQDPPLLTIPLQGGTVTPQTPQNLTFQWQLKNPPPSGFGSVVYLLRLYEITDNKIDPITAISASKVVKVYETSSTTPIKNTIFNYNVTSSTLVEGKKYAWTIEVKEKLGRQSFKNKGVTQVGWFYYGASSGGIITLIRPSDEYGFAKGENRYFKWKSPDNIRAGQKFSYEFRIVKTNGKSGKDAIKNNPDWEKYTSPDQSVLKDFDYSVKKVFEKKEEYAWQVLAFVNKREIAESEISSISIIFFFI